MSASIVTEQPELVKIRLEAGLTERFGDGVGRPSGSRRARLTHPDLRAQRLDEVHGGGL